MFAKFKEQLQRDQSINLSIRVRPGAVKTEVKEIMSDGSIKIAVAAAPEDNAANAELIRFLAEEFEVDRSCVAILSGMTTRRKLIQIRSEYSM